MAEKTKFLTLPKTGFILFMLATIASLAWLGNWQVQRLGWKENLIAQVTTRVEQPTTALPAPDQWPQMQPETYNFTPTTLSGTYLFAHEAYVFTTLHTPRGKTGGQGVWVMTPLQLQSGHLVYINRGFVPYDQWHSGKKDWDNPAGQVNLTGLLRKPEIRDIFTPDPDLEARLFNRRNPQFIAKTVQIDPTGAQANRLAPFFLDAAQTPSGYQPQGGETIRTFTNNHLQYVVTWYGLALAVFGSLIYWLVLQIRSNRTETQT